MIIIWTFSSSILLTTVRWEQPQCYDDSICFAGNEIRYLAHSVIFAFFLPASVTLTLYWRIYKLARNRQQQKNVNAGKTRKKEDHSAKSSRSSPDSKLHSPARSQNTLRVHFGKNSGMVEHQRRVLRTHERIAKTLGVVSCSFLFCWLPFFSLYLTNYKCHGCISPIAIDLASWLATNYKATYSLFEAVVSGTNDAAKYFYCEWALEQLEGKGYCNSMLNPIIYSFTVKEFKRSALRLVIPTWQFAHRCLPKLIPTPPERVAQRMSRHGHRARNKTRHRSFELDNNKANLLSKKIGQKRRQTEPAVFGLQKKVCDAAAEVMIIEEDEDAVQDDYTDTNGFTTYHESSRRLSDLPPRPLLPIVENNEPTTPPPNGECKSCLTDNTCSIKVFCDTSEADL
ncbi:hypothetical protein ANCCEY_10214 [Ancylostoma ceylanicum]|uniref:G-protein coupled receptors family 1 profile domain-containing protein n=1 Tax=Ancylostoma ceylanicum TaxID=53326 RepID=A0A0D6LF15_9BILA|nr:hypothetical protein ANCCEY_10214 [Ancylostoma ceylanicum]